MNTTSTTQMPPTSQDPSLTVGTPPAAQPSVNSSKNQRASQVAAAKISTATASKQSPQLGQKSIQAKDLTHSTPASEQSALAKIRGKGGDTSKLANLFNIKNLIAFTLMSAAIIGLVGLTVATHGVAFPLLLVVIGLVFTAGVVYILKEQEQHQHEPAAEKSATGPIKTNPNHPAVPASNAPSLPGTPKTIENDQDLAAAQKRLAELQAQKQKSQDSIKTSNEDLRPALAEYEQKQNSSEPGINPLSLLTKKIAVDEQTIATCDKEIAGIQAAVAKYASKPAENTTTPPPSSQDPSTTPASATLGATSTKPQDETVVISSTLKDQLQQLKEEDPELFSTINLDSLKKGDIETIYSEIQAHDEDALQSNEKLLAELENLLENKV